MGTITVNVKDEVEKQFRETVKETKGIGKGKLGEAITEALKRWIEEKRQREIGQRQMALMRKGFNMGKILIKTRDELYDRR